MTYQQRHIARVKVAPEVLVKALHFPPGTIVRHVEWKPGAMGDTLVLVVEHKDLAPVDEGVMAPVVAPLIRHHPEHWSFQWYHHLQAPGVE